MSCYIYILYSEFLDRFYIGCSENPEKRLEKHLANHRGYTGRSKDWKIVYTEKFENKTEALRREKYLKGLKNRDRIKSLINK